MGAKEQMIEILRDPQTARIHFNYSSSTASASISRRNFHRVADALESGHLHVVPGRFQDNRLTYSAWASGDDAENTFYLGNNLTWSRDFNALVVHESIHAYFDLDSVGISWLDNEAVAYIAQGFYLRNSGYPQSRLEEDEPYELGYRVAAEYARNNGSPNTWITLLRDKLNTDPRYSSYIHTRFRGDG
jgi:hypothetical protein